MLETLDAPAVRTWCRLALSALGQAREEIDALNVYPVPDGDTGTNLYLTVEAATAAVEQCFESAAAPDLETAVKAMAKGALLGARGNSGVILAELLRGTAEILAERGGGPRALCQALARGADAAYQAVAEPVEGTLLTVARSAAEGAGQAADLLAEVAAAATGRRAPPCCAPPRSCRCSPRRAWWTPAGAVWWPCSVRWPTRWPVASRWARSRSARTCRSWPRPTSGTPARASPSACPGIPPSR